MPSRDLGLVNGKWPAECINNMKKQIKLGEKIYDINLNEIMPGVYKVEINDKNYFFQEQDKGLEKINEEDVVRLMESDEPLILGNGKKEPQNEIRAPLGGTITAVWVKPGDEIKAGQKVVTLIAMKMENEIIAEGDGIVFEVKVAKDQVVNKGELLIKLKPIKIE